MTMSPTVSPPKLLAQPVLLEVVPADDAQAHIAAALAELEQLERELAAVRTEAEALEARVAGPYDAAAHEFVVVRLHRFLEELRAEVNHDITSLVDCADAQGARRRVGLSWDHLFRPNPTLADPTTRPRPLADPVVVPSAPPAPAPAEPGSNGEGAPPPPAPVDSAGAPVLRAVPLVPEATAPIAVPAVVPGGDGPGEDLPEGDWPRPATAVGADIDLESAFWADGEGRDPRRHVLRTARTVGLQAAAVLLVLVAILVRIG